MFTEIIHGNEIGKKECLRETIPSVVTGEWWSTPVWQGKSNQDITWYQLSSLSEFNTIEAKT